jgi:cytochrome c oxidase subunit 4
MANSHDSHDHPDEQAHAEHPHPAEHAHPTWSTYWKVATILTVITVIEVWAYYVPSFVASRAFVPTLLILSAAKFAIVVMFYMHLKYDHKLFRALFTGPLMIAAVTLIALLFLFGQIAARLAHPA